jgi:peptidoglycan/xylan/chitin deacetylase (PgdA/CDA1 family)
MTVQAAKRLARSVLTSSAVYPALKRRARLPGSTAILTYHTLGADRETFDAWTVVRAGDFVRQMELLRRTHEVVTLDALLGDAIVGTRPRAVVTFDDGHAGWHDHLLPLLDALKIPVTLYVATGHIERGLPYWFDRIMNAVQCTVAFTLRGQALGLPGSLALQSWAYPAASGPAHWQVTSSLLDVLKTCSEGVRTSAARAVESATRTLPKRAFTPLTPLSATQIQTLASHPLVTLASHSHDHRLLDQVPLDEALGCIQRSLQSLQAWTQKPVHHFAYPNGNHTEALARSLAGLGLRSATTTAVALHRPGGDVMRLPRLAVGRYDDLARFKLNLVAAL